MVDTLQGADPFTVFAPVKDAFPALPACSVEMLRTFENKAMHAASRKVSHLSRTAVNRARPRPTRAAYYRGGATIRHLEPGGCRQTDIWQFARPDASSGPEQSLSCVAQR